MRTSNPGRRAVNAICVYCGSSPGARADYLEAADALGEELASRSLALIYGGAKVGLMGRVADSVLAHGGHVTGVMPHALADREVVHAELSELHYVDSMHARKNKMVQLADGFIALPGGLGTLEELFEALTWSQLGIHAKPCGLLNVAGYFDSLLQMLDTAVREAFVRPSDRDRLFVGSESGPLLSQMLSAPKADASSRAKIDWVLRQNAPKDGSL